MIYEEKILQNSCTIRESISDCWCDRQVCYLCTKGSCLASYPLVKPFKFYGKMGWAKRTSPPGLKRSKYTLGPIGLKNINLPGPMWISHVWNFELPYFSFKIIDVDGNRRKTAKPHPTPTPHQIHYRATETFHIIMFSLQGLAQRTKNVLILQTVNTPQPWTHLPTSLQMRILKTITMSLSKKQCVEDLL